MNEFLGKLLFPRQQPDVQRRKVRIILAVLLVSLALAGFMAFFLIYSNRMGIR